MSDIDTTNDHLVAVSGRGIQILVPPVNPMQQDEALRLAAYLQLLADPSGERFEEIRTAIANT